MLNNDEGVESTAGIRDGSWNLLELPDDLIAEDPEGFKQWLLAAVATRLPTAFDGSNVTRVGTAALQLLVAFRHACQSLGVTCEIRDASQSLTDTLSCLGLENELPLARSA